MVAVIDIVNLDSIITPEVRALMTPDVVRDIVRNVADAARDKWIQLASTAFNTTFQDYVAGLQPVNHQGMTSTISLVGIFPNMLERGAESRDLREVLLGSHVPVVDGAGKGKREAADGGHYRSIPFRHSTPGSKGFAGTPMGNTSSSFRNTPEGQAIKKLGKQVYAAAKKLAPSTTDAYGNRSKGTRLNTQDMAIPKLSPHHATNIYEGMIKQSKFYRKATQSSYTTFRTIARGPNGEPRGTAQWLRPAMVGEYLSAKVGNYVERIADQAVETYIRGLK